MSWSIHVIPLHDAAEEGVLAWAAAASSTRGVPLVAPAPEPLPSVADVLVSFRDAGCHGTAWFTVTDAAAAPALAECPDPRVCAETGGLDLGEVGLRAVGGSDAVSPGDEVEAISFRKPSGVAVLTAVCRLASAAGPQLVFDDSADRVFVIRPNEDPDDLVGEWPW